MSQQTDADAAQLAELAKNLADPLWRISHLYKIGVKTKTDDIDADGNPIMGSLVVTFKPNRAQRRFIERLHSRNLILKARQLGFTTLICIAWLDHALFNPNSKVGIIAQNRDAAEAIFSEKVRFAYDNLPPALKAAMPTKRDSLSMLHFAHNNSIIRVGTSLRSGTYHRLHISEFGKICAESPQKAAEVMTGSIPTVPLDGGILVIESTAEGADGEFFTLTNTALAQQQAGKKLTLRDYRLHFYPWMDAPEYRMNPEGVIITQEDHDYFNAVEAKIKRQIDIEQRAWYCATRDADFKTKPERMWQEYPSTPEEAFQKSLEGTYYRNQIAAARKEKRIGTVPYTPGTPVNTYWDIGSGDGTAIWFHQKIGARHHFIKFIEGWGEPYSHFVKAMQDTGWIWGTHWLPHDGNHIRQGYDQNLSPKQMLEKLGLRRIEIVPRVEELHHGIQQTRDVFALAWIDETGCKEGITHLEMYRKKYNLQQQCWGDEPVKDVHTEGADSFRQWAQQISGSFQAMPPRTSSSKRTRGSWRTI
jgi:hypothetical protein